MPILNGRDRTSTAMALVGLAIVTPFLAWSLWIARRIRPVADDYCTGAEVAERGVFGAIWNAYNTSAGDLTTVLVNYVVAGLPLAHLPWNLASITTYVFVILAASAFVVVVFAVGWETNRRGWFGLVAVTFVISAGSWIAYFWAPLAWSYTVEEFRFANGVTSWQVVNALYSIPSALISTYLVFLYVRFADRRFWRRPGVTHVLLHFLLGMAGVVASLAFIVVSFSIALWFGVSGHVSSSRKTQSIRQLVIGWGLLGVSWLAGFCIMWFSPGLLARRERYANTEGFVYPLENRTPGALLDFVFPEFFQFWLDGVLSVGAVVVFFLGVLGGTVIHGIARFRYRQESARIFGWSATIAVFSLTLALFARMGQAETYVAFWHFSSSRVATMLAILLLGIAAATYTRTFPALHPAVVGFAAVIVIVLALPAIRLMNQSVYERYSQWQDGPAPISVVRDIEPDSGWVLQCWLRLTELRDDGGRGGSATPIAEVTFTGNI